MNQDESSSPLNPGGNLIAHFGYLNMGTTWLTRALTRVGAELKLPVQVSRTRAESPQYSTKLLIAQHSHLPTDQLRAFYGTHLVRDLRDVAVFGYFRHRETDEAWAHRPFARYGGRTYHAVLNSVDENQGLLEEIRQLSEYAKKHFMRRWVYQNDLFYEMQFEELVERPGKAFHRMFCHYRLDNEASKAATQLARGVGRSIARGETLIDRMETSSGFWRDYMKPVHIERFKELLGDLLIQMGYESDNSW